MPLLIRGCRPAVYLSQYASTLEMTHPTLFDVSPRKCATTAPTQNGNHRLTGWDTTSLSQQRKLGKWWRIDAFKLYINLYVILIRFRIFS